ncbi:glucose/quinate/shikimate family membrane-bound PQQ-dependent dehydrogenase [Vibrio sp. SS-MA-C1-2]|uniref:glucose/quinate/shikimate family membrane-bound PQQ-dependent dehydrogenase n=1 Tax=Vibrio sp. SS-MA-C1-2 TaxID=2908646 RepID=UPI001F344E93|nr:glucose/quinate/shikimate family membrane-bound PQQ-dependent dehydrogenase [Vibrio sp. SS-MA-C1-2]UJF18734.1 glucose/quinate/shikimate family membrane-bound PQQ-dependent dehydrogenase [Vibrio sp. SS-MA-C1-2]
MNKSTSILTKLTIAFSIIAGLYLAGGGIWLLTIGGSPFYLLVGAVFLFIAIRIAKAPSKALLVYAIAMFVTIAWSVWESGFDFWALAPRLDILCFFGIWLLLIRKKLSASSQSQKLALASVVTTFVVMGVAIFNDPQEIQGEHDWAKSDVKPMATDVPDADWPAYGRTQAGQRFSPLTQINADNAGTLKQAWVFQTGDLKRSNDPGEITNEVTPIKIKDTLYLCSSHQKLFALDAKTGKEKWVFDPKIQSNPSFQHLTCRGVSYHEGSADVAPEVAFKECPNRILLPVNDGRLIALNAETGELCSHFGKDGTLDLQQKMPIKVAGMYESTSPPVISKTTIVMAGAIEDNYSTREPSGAIRGFDVYTGKLNWVFDPGAENPNHIPTAGEHYSFNSPNAWAPLAYDKDLDIAYIPLGVPTPDIWGGNRTPNQERYANSLLALNATTGKLVWSYQTVHHDLWDMDVPAQPTLANIKDKEGKTQKAIYVPAKTGNIFVLNRETGKLIVGAPEKPVPQGPAKGDRLSPTQPFSDLSFRPKNPLTGADMWGATMFDQLMCRIQFHNLRYEGIFTPPSEQGTLVFPGNLGMFEWGGISVNEQQQIAIANPIALPFISKLIPRGPGNPIEPKNGAQGSGTEMGIQPQYGIPYGVEINPFLSPIGLPCKQPGWGYMTALDLKTNKIIWKKRVGTTKDSSPIPIGFRVGMPMLGGPISTAGDVAFIAATADNYLRAFKASNGDLLWEQRLPAGGQATPMTYEVDGKQYVVISAGGHGSFGTTMGDYIIAYALPDAK